MTDEPLDWTLRVSVDGAQRLLHAWKDGRLEKTLGFPIESLQIHTPFTPTPGGGGSAPPDDDSRPITLLPWDGLSIAGMVVVQASAGGPAGPKGGEPGGGSAARARAPDPAIEDVGPSVAPQGRRGRGARRVALALAGLAAGLIALWLDRSSPDEPTPETSPPQVTSPSAAKGLPSSAAADDSHPSAAGAESSAAWEPAATTGETDLAGSVPDAAAQQTTEPAAPLPQAPAAPPAHDAILGPTGGVASDDEVGPVKPRSRGAGKPRTPRGVAPKPPKNKALYVHYRCETKGAEFAIVVHARNVGDAKASACGGRGDACVAATTCVETQM